MAKAGVKTEIGTCPACGGDGLTLRDVGGIMVCEKCSLRRFSNRVRKSIQEAFDRQADKKRREAWRKRLDIARRGVTLYQQGQFGRALNIFEDYIKVLENRHNLSSGGIRPSHFDKNKDAAELLLIAGIYWDMAKIYDRMKGQESQMRMALNKFIEFSMGRPHLVLAAEALRKHLDTGGTVHVQDFKNAYDLVNRNVTKCFIASAVFGTESPEVFALREFRDEFLMKYSSGRLFVRAYYAVSPVIATIIERTPVIANAIRPSLAWIARRAPSLYKHGR